MVLKNTPCSLVLPKMQYAMFAIYICRFYYADLTNTYPKHTHRVTYNLKLIYTRPDFKGLMACRHMHYP